MIHNKCILILDENDIKSINEIDMDLKKGPGVEINQIMVKKSEKEIYDEIECTTN